MPALTLSLIVAALFAGQTAGGDVACARNFTVEDLGGLIAQVQAPNGPVGGPIRYTIWRPNGEFRMEWWNVRQDTPSIDEPSSLNWEFELDVPDGQSVWARFWGDDRFVGQQLMVDRPVLRAPSGRSLRRLSVNDRALLRQLVRSEQWEVEIVTAAGASLMRRPIPAPPASALRASLVEQTAWLDAVRAARLPPNCHRMPMEEELL